MITIDYIEQGGVKVALPTEARINNFVKQARRNGTAEEIAAAEAYAKSARDRLAEVGDKVQKENFQFTPYTFMDKRTIQMNNRIGPADANNYDWVGISLDLTVKATGMSKAEIGALSPSMADALMSEVKRRSEPDALSLDFFD